MGLAKEKLYQTMGLARPTVDRKVRRRSLLLRLFLWDFALRKPIV